MRSLLLLLVLFALIWIVSIALLFLPAYGFEEKEISRSIGSDWTIYHNKVGDRIILVDGGGSSTAFILLDTDLNELGRFSGRAWRESNFYTPIWSQDGEYIFVQDRYRVAYLSSKDLSLQYLIHKRDDLGLDTTIYPHLNIDSDNNLIYVDTSQKIISLNPLTNISRNIGILGNNESLIVDADPNHRYLVFRCCNHRAIEYNKLGDEYLLIFDTEKSEFYRINNTYLPDNKDEEFYLQFIFAPTKPYLAIVTSFFNFTEIYHSLNMHFRVLNLETRTLEQEHILPRHKSARGPTIDVFNKLAWSADSSEILLIKQSTDYFSKSSHAGPNVFNSYNVITGEKRLSITISRGPLYEDDIRDYSWFSEKNLIVYIDDPFRGIEKLKIQRIDDSYVLQLTVVDYIFAYIGLLTSLLVFLVYIHVFPLYTQGLHYHWRSLKGEKTKLNIEIPEGFFQKQSSILQISLALHYLFYAYYYRKINVLEFDRIRVSYHNQMVLAIFSFLDITIIILFATSYLLKYTRHDVGWREIKLKSMFIGLIMILGRVIMSYPFGYKPQQTLPVLNGIILFIIVIPLLLMIYNYFSFLIEARIIQDTEIQKFFTTGIILSIILNYWYTISLISL